MFLFFGLFERCIYCQHRIWPRQHFGFRTLWNDEGGRAFEYYHTACNQALL